MATTTNVITTRKFAEVVGVLFLLGISLKSINGNSQGLFQDSSHGFRWGLYESSKTALDSTSDTINDSTDKTTSTTEEPFETTTIKGDEIVLTLSNPEKVLDLTRGNNFSLRVLDNEYVEYKQGLELVIHLWKCEYDEDESIQIYAMDGYINEILKCNQSYQGHEKRMSSRYYVGSGQNSSAFVSGINANDGEAWIAANFKPNSTATVVINIYWIDYDSQRTCGSRFFNCFESYDYCPPCCEIMDFRTLQCIPIQLQCNGRPNCWSFSQSDAQADESYETCNLKTICPPCPSFCLSWNYIITSLAIAVLFIVTPTVIVFGLFYRRNVALERARLERLTQARMADMRGEFTLDSPITDVPPSYEEVYDTKEPPPCFCQAVAMGGEVEVLQTQAQNIERMNGDQYVDVDATNQESPGAEGTDSGPTVVVQNLGFHCSCSNLGDLAVDHLPSYEDVNESSNISLSPSPN